MDRQAIEDQRRAAAQEANRRWMDDADRLLRRDPRSVALTGVRPKDPTWADRFLLKRIAMRARGEIYVCEHLNSPDVTYLPTWAAAMTCATCMSGFPPSEDDDDRCDICGEHPIPTVSYVVRIGEYMVIGGICTTCRDDEIKQTRKHMNRWPKKRENRQ